MRRANLKNRRGVFVVIFGIMLVGLMAAAAVSIDLSRTWAFRNELQTAADAAALAGAVQLGGGSLDPTTYGTVARQYAHTNSVLRDSVTVELVERGNWNDSLGVFNDSAAATGGGLPLNAVRVVVNHDVTSLWGRGLLGVLPFKIRARAIAWADAGVTNTSCIKPWAIPYQALLSRVNDARGIPNDAAGLTRDFTAEDRAVLDSMDVESRTFTLKLGSQTLSDFGDVTTYPGNYQAVQLPRKYLDDGVTQNPDWTPGGGAAEYEAAIAGATCHTLKVGDILATEPGNMVNATLDGADASKGTPAGVGPCADIIGNEPGDPLKRTPWVEEFGNCVDADGNPGVDVKAAFFLCTSACNGKDEVSVRMLGSFTLKKVYPDGWTCQQQDVNAGRCTPEQKGQVMFSKTDIVGIFNPLQDTGEVGPGSSTLRRIILVECAGGRRPCT